LVLAFFFSILCRKEVQDYGYKNSQNVQNGNGCFR
jgi:hypothetical protein